MNKHDILDYRHALARNDDLHDALDADRTTSFDVAAMLRRLWSAAYRNRWAVAAIIAGALALGVVATMLQAPRYVATASVQIDQQTNKVLGTEDVDPSAANQDADRFLQTQIDVLRSRTMAQRVADNLTLGASDNFVLAMGAQPIDETPDPRALPEAKRMQIQNLLRAHMSVNLRHDSRVADISFASPDPATARRVADGFARDFVTYNLKRKFDQSAYARDFLRQQLVEAKDRLERSERATLAYSRAQGLIDASAGITKTGIGASNAPSSLVTSDLVSFNIAYTGARTARIQAEKRWEQAQQTPLLALPEVLTNAAINQMIEQRAEAQANYDRDRRRYKPDFPALQQLAGQIAGLDAQIATVARSILTSIGDQYRTALAQERALSTSVDGLKTATLAEQDKSVRYNILRRETDTNRTMYDGLLQRYKELAAQAGISASNISLVDGAELPRDPVSPRPLLNIAAALLAGVALAVVAVFLRENFDDAVRSPDDVQTKLGLSFLDSVPALARGVLPLDALADPRSPFSESYAALRTSLELAHSGGLAESMLFTSSRPAEGKSTSAHAVARDFAKIGKHVLLIDGDLRRPTLHKLFGLTNLRGFSSLLARQGTIKELVQPTSIANLSFLSAGPLPPSPAELLSGPGFGDAMRALEDRFDLIVVDGPPVLGLADAVILAAGVQGIVFVVEAGASHRGQAKAAIRRLHATKTPILGALLTKFDERKIGYAYDYYNYTATDPVD